MQQSAGAEYVQSRAQKAGSQSNNNSNVQKILKQSLKDI